MAVLQLRDIAWPCFKKKNKKIMPKYLIFVLLLSNLRKFDGTVLRGSRALDGQFPWLIQFHTVSPCGGVLISPDWVLTAAQCVQYNRNSIVLYAAGLNGTGSNQTVSVKATYMYPQFQAYSETRDYDNNIALLKLVKAFDMCDPRIRLLDIAPVRLDDDYKSCLIFGWQSTVGPLSKVHAKPIQYSQVLLNSWRICMYMHEGNASYRNVFCTMVEDENGMTACAGNPGSPVVCEDQYRRMVLLGIASWSNFSLDCGGLPTYLGVSVFRSWMWDLIYGSKNLEQWESGAEIGTGACQHERRLGDIRAENNFRHGNTRNYTDVGINGEKFVSTNSKGEGRGMEKNAYDLPWRSYNDKIAGSEGRRMSGITKIPEIAGKLEPPIFDRIDDYTRILDPEDFRNAKNFDVVRAREEQLSQYREIGGLDHHRDADIENEPIAVPSQHEKIAYIDDKSMKINFDRESNQESTENFDVIELVMPDGIEDFDRSSSARIIFYKNFTTFFATFFLLAASMFLW